MFFCCVIVAAEIAVECIHCFNHIFQQRAFFPLKNKRRIPANHFSPLHVPVKRAP
jgi:hypothetical protein